MRAYLIFVLRRFVQFLAVLFLAITAVFFITHLTPNDPVEQTLARINSGMANSPEVVAEMRRTLTELYGLQGSLWEQYVEYWQRMARGDLGPSLSAFPAPVTSLVARAAPWTAGLLVTSTVIAWTLGNLLGGLAGYYRQNRLLKAAEIAAMGLQPIPYYVLAFVLLILFGYVWPILPITGAYVMNRDLSFSLSLVLDVLRHSILPAVSLILVGIGGWFIGMRALVSNLVTEDYVLYAELGGVDRGRILRSYVMRNALMPQITGLAMNLGAIFSGTVITEEVYGYPGMGKLLVDGVNSGDYSLVLGVAVMSILGVAAAVFLVDILYPLLDPRVRLG